MSAADAYKAIVWANRNIPGLYGLRPHTVEIGVSTWTGDDTGKGTRTTTWTTIAENGGVAPKVRVLKDEEIAVGSLAADSIRIGPITPEFPGGGTSVVTLAGSIASKKTRHLRITGPQHPSGALYVIRSVDFSGALHLYITAEPVAQLVAQAILDGALTDADGNILTDADGNPLFPPSADRLGFGGDTLVTPTGDILLPE